MVEYVFYTLAFFLPLFLIWIASHILIIKGKFRGPIYLLIFLFVSFAVWYWTPVSAYASQSAEGFVVLFTVAYTSSVIVQFVPGLTLGILTGGLHRILLRKLKSDASIAPV